MTARASTGTPGARDPSAPTTRRSVKREPEPLSEGSRRNGTDADPVVVIDDDDEEDGEEVQAQAPQSSHRRSASTTTPSKQKQIVEVVIDVASPKRSTHQRDSVELPADDEDDQTTADDLMASQQLEGEAYTDDQPPESEDAILPDDEVIDDDLLQAAIADEQDGTDEQPPVADDATPLDQPAQVAELAAAMAPVPVPTATQFRTAVAQTATAATVTEDNSQSTASLGATQLDPIQQFSSPARDPAVRSKGKDKAPTPTRSAEPAPAPASAIVSGPKIVKRFINGEEVMAIESESSDGDRGDTPPQPQPLPPVASVVVVEEEIVQVEVVEQTTTEVSTRLGYVSDSWLTCPGTVARCRQYSACFRPSRSPVTRCTRRRESVCPTLLTILAKLTFVSLPAESAAPHADGSNAVEPEPASGPNEIEKLAALMKRLAESASEQQPSDPIRLEDHDLSPAASEIANLLLASQVETKRWRSRAKKAEKSAKRATEDAQQDLAFIREQYTNASNSAVEAVSKSQELEEKVSVLKGQLKYGLKQREVHTAAIKAQHDKEVAQLRAQLQLLLAQSRKTDDRVRAKAAAHDRMRNEVQAKQALIDQLQAVGVDLNMQITDLSNRNNELLGQVELFRARELGVVGPKAAQETDSDASYESSYGSSDDDDDDQSQDAIPTRVLRKSHQEDPLTASQLMPETQDFAPVPNPPTPSAPAALAPAPVDPKPVRAIHKGSTIPSPWAPGIFYADEVVSSSPPAQTASNHMTDI